MAWTIPKTWATNELVTASMMNTHVRDNLSYLLNGVQHSIAATSTQVDTTSTTYVNITGLELNMTPVGSRIAALAFLGARTSTAGQPASFRLALWPGNVTGMAINLTATVGPVMLYAAWTGLTPGSAYSVACQHMATSGYTAGINYASNGVRVSWLRLWEF